MRDEFYKTEPFNTMYSTFGGLICHSDFAIEKENTYHTLADIAQRIANDWKFDEQCRKNLETRKRQMQHEGRI